MLHVTEDESRLEARSVTAKFRTICSRDLPLRETKALTVFLNAKQPRRPPVWCGVCVGKLRKRGTIGKE